MVVLSAHHLVKRFGGVRALVDVSFELRAGEVHALVGENGAGKSTLIGILTGAVQPDEGGVRVANLPENRLDTRSARAAGIAAVYQHPALFPDLTIAENLALRLEPARLWRVLNWRARRRRAADLLAQVGAPGLAPEARVGELGMAQQQLVEIAAAIGSSARILIFDEPTASLGAGETENLLAMMRQFKARGIGMIYVSHRLEELPQIADRVTVLRDGACVATRPMADLDRAELVRLMVGRPLESVFPKAAVPIGPVVLEARDLACQAANVRDVNLAVRAGEIVGLAGLVGAGRTELARILFGITPADAGTILIHGSPARIMSPMDAVRHRLAYVPEDRRRHGVIPEMTIAQNTTLASLRRIARGGLLNFARERAVAQSYMRRLRTKAPSVEATVQNLSGGNQQKVALARWLITQPSILILDEPTQGIDVGAKAEIHQLIGDLAGRGLAILLISSELPEVLAMSDRIAVMRNGTIAGILTRQDATPQRVLELSLNPSEAKAVA